MSIDFDPYGPLRRKLASDGVDIAAKFVKRRPAATPAAVRSHIATGRNRIASVRRLAFAFAALGVIAPVALTTIAFGDELRDTGGAGVEQTEPDEATAPKLSSDGLRAGETGIVPSQVDTRDQEKGTGNSPTAAPSVTCAEALASEPLQNMDQYLKDIGINYERIFDQTLSDANCTGRQVVDFLLENGAKLYSYREYEGEEPRNVYSLTYRSGSLLRRLFIFFPFHIVIVENTESIFVRSNWEIDL